MAYNGVIGKYVGGLCAAGWRFTLKAAAAASIIFSRVLTPVAKLPGGPIRSEMASRLRAETALPPEWHHRVAIQR
jgi:hypothetical protein